LARPRPPTTKPPGTAGRGGAPGRGLPADRAEPPSRDSSDALFPLLFHVEQVQQKLGEVGRMADQTERLAVLGTMAASVAHEINNILTPVKAYAELALSSPGDTGLVVKALERAAAGVDRATRISELILACARSRPGEPPARSDVGEVSRRAVAALPPDHGHAFPVELRVPRGLFAAIDAVALEQVLVNVLLNARGAMGAAGTTLIVATIIQERLPMVEVRVTDTGCGIAPERLGSVFDVFVSYPGAEGRQAGHGGGGRKRTGLGLAICRRLLAEAEGRIEVESEVGRGTTVKIVVPLATAEELRASA
jgi:signal transduction histidine kinase